MLPSQLNFKMQYRLSVAEKPEMAWLDHAGMDWTYTNFMQLIPLYFIKRIIVNDLIFIGPVEGIAYRLGPWTIDKLNAKIFGDLTFINVEGVDFTRNGSELHFFFHRHFVRK